MPPTLVGLVGLVVGRHVIEGGDVDELVDLAAEPVTVGRADPQPRLGEVTDDRLDPALEPVELGGRAGAHQDEHPGVVAGEQAVDQVPADEAGAAGHEVGGHPASVGLGR